MANMRLQKLLEMEAQKPADPFIKFAIAQEYINDGDVEKAKTCFEHLTTHFPGYVPTYYQLGKLYEQLNDFTNAIATYRTGIEKAGASNDFKTANELREALMMLEDGD